MFSEQQVCDSYRIRLFLDHRLGDADLTVFEAHLSECDDCRRRLETSVASEELWSEMRESLRDEHLPRFAPSLATGSEQAAREADSALDSAAEETFSSQTTILKLLAPTDDDRSLGRWGTYEVVGIVGSGGMGVVLKALDAALNRYVAIKILAPHLGSSGAARKRFSREGRASAAVVHDNVIEIYHVSEAAGLPYLVMPYVRGPSLQRRLDDEGSLAAVEILRVGMQAAAGMAAAHAQGLVHRDVKPANILLAGGIERVKLTDFGLARAADDASLTKTGIIAGTPQYMSPEQARGEPVDQRSDLFSLGSVLYAMCTGRPPFRAETSYGVLRRITDDEPRPIREINPDIPDWLCGIGAKLMAKRPDERFQSASEVAALLEQCLAHVQQPTTVPLPKGVAELCRPEQAQRSSGNYSVRSVLAGTALRLFRPTGWSGRKRILTALIALLFFGGLGLSLGILIHLKKDNKTTTVEVPEGSTAHVGADGAVTVELPSSPTLAAQSSERSLPALCFDGRPGSYVSVPNMDMTRLTFATWVKRDATQQQQYVIMSSRSGGWGVYFSQRMPHSDNRDPHNDLLWFTDRGHNCGSSDEAVADTQWHFVAVTLEDRLLHFYVDGKPAGKATMPNELAGQGGDYWLGGVTPGDTTPHDGLRGCLAETLILNRALDSDEIASLYHRGRSPHGAMIDGLIAGYHFDEGHGTTVNDFSDHGRNGTLHGGVKWLRDAVIPLSEAGGKEDTPNGTESSAEKARASQRIATLEELLRAVETDNELGFGNLSEVYDARDKLLDAQLEAARTKAERIAVWERLMGERREMEEKAEANFKVGNEAGSKANFLRRERPAKRPRPAWQERRRAVAHRRKKMRPPPRKSGSPSGPRRLPRATKSRSRKSAPSLARWPRATPLPSKGPVPCTAKPPPSSGFTSPPTQRLARSRERPSRKRSRPERLRLS